MTAEDEDGAGSRSQADVAHSLVKRKIIELELAPGEFFSEAQLSSELGVGRTPLREALARLRLENLVEVAPRSGHQVTPLTLDAVSELFNVRRLIEGEAAALAAARGARDIQKLHELELLCRYSYDPSDLDSVRRFTRANTEFHCAIPMLAGNGHLAMFLRYTLEHMERYMHLHFRLNPNPEECVHGHEELLGALLSGDEEEARRVARAEISAAQRKMMQELLASESLNKVNLAGLPRAEGE